ncbi:MAG: hypothetical protein OJF50_000690 [Nitrospira sp.]|nr:hypothetical protein [Nitrospira sp.]
MLNELALSQKPKRQGRTTEVTGRGLPKKHGRMSSAADVTDLCWRGCGVRRFRARQANGHPWQNSSERPTMTDERACFSAMGKGTECRTRQSKADEQEKIC